MFIIVEVRLSQLQFGISEHSSTNGGSSFVPTSPVQRGAIYDRNGNLLAFSLEAYTIELEPARINDRVATARILSRHLGESPQEYLKKMDSEKVSIRLAKGIKPESVWQMRCDLAEMIYPGLDLAVNRELIGSAGLEDNDIFENAVWNPKEANKSDRKDIYKTLAKAFRFKSKPGQNVLNEKTLLTENISCYEAERALKKLTSVYKSGINCKLDFRRIYPSGTFAANLLGIVGSDGEGLEGLEYSLNSTLNGRDGNTEILDDKVIKGNNIVLTIDEPIQAAAEEVLKETADYFGARGKSCIIVLDPVSGEILAMANYPTFNPNDYQATPVGDRLNYSVARCYEPGSVMKIFGASALLETGAINLDDPVYCENGYWRIYGKPLKDVDPFEWLNFAGVITHSSNIGMAKCMRDFNPGVFYDYLLGFGFGSKTGIDLPGEIVGILSPAEKWQPFSMISIPIGQGIAVTPIQLVMAYAALGNDGILMKPSIIKQIISSEGEVRWSAAPRVAGRAIKPYTNGQVRDILKSVVEEGSGKKAQVAGFEVCGKTGTGQIWINADPEKGVVGHYSHSHLLACFAGFAPAENPEIAALVLIEDPKGPYKHAGNVAAPAFSKIVSAALMHRSVETGIDLSTLIARGEKVELPSFSEQVEWEGDKAKCSMPDLRGFTMAKVQEVLSSFPVDCEISGSGVLVKQYPRPGQVLIEQTVCKLSFAPITGKNG